MIENAFTYPTSHDTWKKTLIIGGVLTFFGFLLIPIFAVLGYLLRVIRTTIEGESSPPEFGDWRNLIVQGFKAWVIGVIYMLIPAIVASMTIGGAVAAMATGSEGVAAVGLAGMFGGLVLTAILGLVFGYFSVAAIVLFAHEETFGAAFDVGHLQTVAFNADYAIAWLVSVVVFIVAGIVGGIPLIGFILGPFVSFYAMMVAGRLWAGGYMDAVGGASGAPFDAEDRSTI